MWHFYQWFPCMPSYYWFFYQVLQHSIISLHLHFKSLFKHASHTQVKIPSQIWTQWTFTYELWTEHLPLCQWDYYSITKALPSIDLFSHRHHYLYQILPHLIDSFFSLSIRSSTLYIPFRFYLPMLYFVYQLTQSVLSTYAPINVNVYS